MRNEHKCPLFGCEFGSVVSCLPHVSLKPSNFDHFVPVCPQLPPTHKQATALYQSFGSRHLFSFLFQVCSGASTERYPPLELSENTQKKTACTAKPPCSHSSVSVLKASVHVLLRFWPVKSLVGRAEDSQSTVLVLSCVHRRRERKQNTAGQADGQRLRPPR